MPAAMHSLQHLAPTPGPSQQAPASAADLSSPITARGLEVLEETEGILGAVSALPPAEQVPVLERRLRASATMFDQVVQENIRLAKEKESAEQDTDLAKEMLKRHQGLPPDVVSENSPVANRQELSLMQQQMSATCQELIAARKLQKEKDAVIRDLKVEHANDRMLAAEATKAEIASLEQQVRFVSFFKIRARPTTVFCSGPCSSHFNSTETMQTGSELT